jgi:hypothetical protein
VGWWKGSESCNRLGNSRIGQDWEVEMAGAPSPLIHQALFVGCGGWFGVVTFFSFLVCENVSPVGRERCDIAMALRGRRDPDVRMEYWQNQISGYCSRVGERQTGKVYGLNPISSLPQSTNEKSRR